MEKIRVKIGWSGDNYSCVSDCASLNGIVLATSKTLEGLKEKFQESLQFHIEGCIQDGDQLPEWLVQGQYELCFHASGYKIPRPQQKEKITNAIHNIGRELVSVV